MKRRKKEEKERGEGERGRESEGEVEERRRGEQRGNPAASGLRSPEGFAPKGTLRSQLFLEASKKVGLEANLCQPGQPACKSVRNEVA